MAPALFLTLSGLAIALFVGLDLLAPRFRAALLTDRTLRLRNLGYIGGNVVSMASLQAVNAWLASHIHGVIDWSGVGVVVEVVCCVIVAELINWLSHWIKHVRPWLWNFHIQHHVGRHYDTTLTLHTHPVDVVVSGAAMSAALLILGFSKLATDCFILLYFVSNLYKHNHKILHLGPLDAIFVSGPYHRIHHHPHRRGNYGSVLTLFDVVFRTAVWPGQGERDNPLAHVDNVAGVDDHAVGVDGVAERSFLTEMLLPLRPR